MPLMEDLVSVLQTAGIGVDNATLFRGRNAIIPVGDGPYGQVILTSGSGSERTHNSAPQPAYEYVGAQIVWRGANSVTTFNKATQAKVALQAVRNEVIGSTYIRDITAGNISDGGKDDNKRAMWKFNIIGCRRPEGVS